MNELDILTSNVDFFANKLSNALTNGDMVNADIYAVEGNKACRMLQEYLSR